MCSLFYQPFAICSRFCAHEFEKIKDMASAALAYKCVEVAYLRVINSSHSSVSKDRHELQSALQIVPPGICRDKNKFYTFSLYNFLISV